MHKESMWESHCNITALEAVEISFRIFVIDCNLARACHWRITVLVGWESV